MKQFKTESKRILDLMINSIYTNKEIFLRELISNASDAIDKLHFISLTDSEVNSDFKIKITIDKILGQVDISFLPNFLLSLPINGITNTIGIIIIIPTTPDLLASLK